MKKLLLTTLCFALCLSLVVAASAATKTGYMTVSAEVAVTCVMSVGHLNFGQYDGSYLQMTSQVDVQCTNGIGYEITYGPGENFSDNKRYMRITEDPGTSVLEYRLDCQVSPTEPDIAGECGDGATFGEKAMGTGNGSVQSFMVEGSIPPGQFLPFGDYMDNVLVTLTY